MLLQQQAYYQPMYHSVQHTVFALLILSTLLGILLFAQPLFLFSSEEDGRIDDLKK